MKDQRIIEAYDQMLPEKGRHEKNLEQIISRLEAQESEGALFCEEDKRNGTEKNQKTNTSIKMLKRITAVAAALIAAIGIMFATNNEASAGVLNWVRHVDEDNPSGYMYEFKGDRSNKKLPQITIGWLPEDFEGIKPQIGELNDDYTFDRLYTTKNGRIIDFSIVYMERGERVYILPEFGEVLHAEEFIIKEKKAHYYEDSQSKCLFVFDDETGLMIQINANIEKEEMIKIAENIQFVFE